VVAPGRYRWPAWSPGSVTPLIRCRGSGRVGRLRRRGLGLGTSAGAGR
jgi:hypothetical protein